MTSLQEPRFQLLVFRVKTETGVVICKQQFIPRFDHISGTANQQNVVQVYWNHGKCMAWQEKSWPNKFSGFLIIIVLLLSVIELVYCLKTLDNLAKMYTCK